METLLEQLAKDIIRYKNLSPSEQNKEERKALLALMPEDYIDNKKSHNQ